MNLNILKAPYPFNNSLKKEILSSVVFGLFVFLFLLLFQPFGLSNYQSPSKTFELGGYGIVTTLVLFSNTLAFTIFLPKWFTKSTWTVGKNILYSSYIFFSIGVGNLIYSAYLGYLSLDIQGFLIYQGITLLVGLFPFTISTFLIYNNRLKKVIKEANHLNATLSSNANLQEQLLEIPSLNKSERFSINLKDLIAIKAVENYVEVYSISNTGLNKWIIRNTMKNIEAIFSSFPFIRRCHRSYLVNLQNVAHFSGNAQGLTLDFNLADDLIIPVSRSYVKTIKNELKYEQS